MDGLKLLLENVWICRDTQKEAYFRVKHELPDFQKFLREMPGWKIVSTEGLLKLEKIPAHAESFMGIQAFTDVRDYCFLCVVLMFLEDKEDGQRFLLTELVSYVEAQLKGEMETDFTSFAQRKSLVRVLQYLVKCRMLIAHDGSTDAFGQDAASEVLYENTGYSRFFATNFPGGLKEVHSLEDLEKRTEQEPVPDRSAERRHRVYRQLIACPMMSWEDKDDEDAQYVRSERTVVARHMEEYLGGRLDLHRGAAFWVLPEDGTVGSVHPRDAQIAETVLLLCSQLREGIREGVWRRDETDCVTMSREEWEEEILSCRRKYGSSWSKEYREMDPRKLIREVNRYMTSWLMIRLRGEEVVLTPMVGKAGGFYPPDGEEKGND